MAHKTTVYLPDELDAAVKREAKLRACSEAEVIRSAIAAAVQRQAPSPGIIRGEPFAERTDDLLHGFGDR